LWMGWLVTLLAGVAGGRVLKRLLACGTFGHA